MYTLKVLVELQQYILKGDIILTGLYYNMALATVDAVGGGAIAFNSSYV